MAAQSWILEDSAQTEAVGAAIGGALEVGDFVGLIGPLGAGKTCLTRGLMAGLSGGAASVSSPTYTLLNHYDAPRPFEVVLHADLYRLEGLDDLASTGYWDEIEQADLTLVEWIDKVPEAWPGVGLEVTLAYTEDGKRSIALAWHGVGGAERLEAVQAAVTSVVG